MDYSKDYSENRILDKRKNRKMDYSGNKKQIIVKIGK